MGQIVPCLSFSLLLHALSNEQVEMDIWWTSKFHFTYLQRIEFYVLGVKKC